MSDAYDPDLRRAFFKAAKELGMQKIVREGTYCYVAGPSYETRGEARLLVQAGGDAVGMSTVPEVVVARHAGIRVLGISLITNRVPYRPVPSVSHEILGTPVPTAERDQPPEQVVNHEEVLEVSAMRAKELQGLVRKKAKPKPYLPQPSRDVEDLDTRLSLELDKGDPNFGEDRKMDSRFMDESPVNKAHTFSELAEDLASRGKWARAAEAHAKAAELFLLATESSEDTE
ncbi:hypothetical protein HDU93_003168, partial [Gonapodya sp. JEL0774]